MLCLSTIWLNGLILILWILKLRTPIMLLSPLCYCRQLSWHKQSRKRYLGKNWSLPGNRTGTAVRLIRDNYQVVRFLSVALTVKNPLANTGDTGDMGSIPRSGRSPGEGNGDSLQYSCLENSMERGAWWARVHGVTKSRTQLKQLSRHCTNTRLISILSWSLVEFGASPDFMCTWIASD